MQGLPRLRLRAQDRRRSPPDSSCPTGNLGRNVQAVD